MINDPLQSALALGFSSVEAMNDHQEWLRRNKQVEEQIKKQSLIVDVDAPPDRIVINQEGEALNPERAAKLHIYPFFVFVRNDGWTLGTPTAFEDVAYKLWEKEWVAFYTTSGPARFVVRNIDQYQHVEQSE